MNEVTNLLIVGVGGQGTILASRVISQVLLAAGHDVKVSEIHGMSQRGGSVVTQVRFGQKVFSPIIARGTADYILGFEKLEAYRWLPYLAPKGMMLVNEQKMDPMPVITGAEAYPEKIIEKLRNAVTNVEVVPALELARKAGSVKAVNVVLLGVLARHLQFKKEMWLKVMRQVVPPKTIDVNNQAFELGITFSS